MDWQLLIQNYGYLFLVVGMIIEGQTVIILSGFLAYLGYFDIFTAMLITFPTIFLADMLAHQLAFYWGRRQINKHGRFFCLKPERVAKIEKFFQAYGGWVIFFSKLIWGLGRNVLIVAGLFGKPLKQLYKYDFAGCLASVLVFTSLGFFLGHSYVALEKVLKGFGLTVILILLLVIVFEKLGVNQFIKQNIIKKRNSQPEADPRLPDRQDPPLGSSSGRELAENLNKYESR